MELKFVDKALETTTPRRIAQIQLAKLKPIVARAWKSNGFYREFWARHGAKPKAIASLDQFAAEIPIARKADFIADQKTVPPYGQRLAGLRGAKRPHLVFTTSGTSGQGVEVHAQTHAERLRSYKVSDHLYRWGGLKRGDSVFLCYPITLLGGGRIEIYGIESYGLTVFPVGNYDVERKLDLMERFKPDAVIATTSYLGHLAAVGAKRGKLHRPKALFGGGEGASYSWFEKQQEIWGAPIYNHYGATQTRVDHIYPCERGIGTRAHPALLHNIAPWFILEVVDPATGKHVKDGERGEMVITSLVHTDYPFIRHGMGDAAVYRESSFCPCGRPFSGVEIGTLERMDDMKKLKGINVWPQSVDESVFAHDGVDEYQVVLTRDDRAADVATVRVMPKPGVGPEQARTLCAAISSELRRRIGLNFVVEPAAEGEVKHSEYKARRWSDRRDSPVRETPAKS